MTTLTSSASLHINHLYTHVITISQKADTAFKERIHPLLERITDTYNTSVQDFSQWLYRQGKPFAIPSFIAASMLGEPIVTIKSSLNYIDDWKGDLKEFGIFDLSSPDSLKSLEDLLKQDKSRCSPVLLLHGSHSTPNAFIYWAKELQQAVKENKIGPVVTLQLPSSMDDRMLVVYEAVNRVSKLCESTWGQKDAKIDIIGHSLGGYTAHLAKTQPKHIQIKDENGIERRWHSIDPSHRNEKVGKVVSIAAPTWLCCQGQQDATSPFLKHQDIYPLKVFTAKNIETAFTPEQLITIRNHHPDILDIIATQDAISAIVSPLPEKQVVNVKHKHVGVMHDPAVCKLAIDFFASKHQVSMTSWKSGIKNIFKL